MGKTGTGEKSSAQGYLNQYVVSFLGFFPYKRPRYGVLLLFDAPQASYTGGSLAAPAFSSFLRSIRRFLDSRAKLVKASKLMPPRSKSYPARAGKHKLFDLRGLSAVEAVELLSSVYDLPAKLYGSGYVYKQIPPPGTKTKNIKEVRLYLRKSR